MSLRACQNDTNDSTSQTSLMSDFLISNSILHFVVHDNQGQQSNGALSLPQGSSWTTIPAVTLLYALTCTLLWKSQGLFFITNTKWNNNVCLAIKTGEIWHDGMKWVASIECDSSINKMNWAWSKMACPYSWMDDASVRMAQGSFWRKLPFPHSQKKNADGRLRSWIFPLMCILSIVIKTKCRSQEGCSPNIAVWCIPNNTLE